MSTTRREFIKLLTGTVIAISLPTGLISSSKKEDLTKKKFGTKSCFYDGEKEQEFEFALENIEIIALSTSFGWAVRGMGVPKNKRISPAYFAVRIDDIKDWGNKSFKKEVIKDIKFNLGNHFKNRRII